MLSGKPNSEVSPVSAPKDRLLQSESVQSQASLSAASTMSRKGSVAKEMEKKPPFSIPFALAINVEILLSCFAIAAVIFGLASANTRFSNDMCVSKGVESVQTMALSLQTESADLVSARVLRMLQDPVSIVKENVLFFNSTYLIAEDYDRLFPLFLNQLRKYESLSLVYFISATTKDYIGTRKMEGSQTEFGVDFQDEGRFSNQSRCPKTCPPEIAANRNRMVRFQFRLDKDMRIITPAYSAVAYDGTTRAAYTATSRLGFSKVAFAPPHIYSSGLEVGMNCGAQVYSTPANGSRPTLQGVFAIGMSFGSLKQTLVSLPLSENGVAVVFDTSGILIGSSVTNETSTITVNGTASFKTILDLDDPVSRFATTALLDRLFGGVSGIPRLSNGLLNLTNRIPSDAVFDVPIPDTLASRLRGDAASAEQRSLMLLVRTIREDNGLNLFVVVSAPVADFSGNVEQVSRELRRRLDRNVTIVILIGCGLVVGFVALSVPITIYTLAKPMQDLSFSMQEASRFDFTSLHEQKNKHASFIQELGTMQMAYWNMILNFSKAVMQNKKLVGVAAARPSNHGYQSSNHAGSTISGYTIS
ncbi:hypothetical protein HDU96_003513 [Phlyctochytrium bullatum]|nr:hypothetical protein HDU96_003513 [Phlyctochytrium bullatum]